MSGDRGVIKPLRRKTQEEIDAEHKKLSEALGKLSYSLVEYFEDIPNQYKRLYANARLGKTKRAAAIRAKCFDCSAYSRKEIEVCSCLSCPLYNFRPVQALESENAYRAADTGEILL